MNATWPQFMTSHGGGHVNVLKQERKTLDWDDYSTTYPDKPGASDGQGVVDAAAGDSAGPGPAGDSGGSGERGDHSGGTVPVSPAGDTEGLDDGLMATLRFHVSVASLYDEASSLLLRKHQDYGPKNIAEAPGGALNGLLVRMHDKQARLNHLVFEKKSGPDVAESLEDTLLDLANYSLIAVLVLRGEWPGAE